MLQQEQAHFDARERKNGKSHLLLLKSYLFLAQTVLLAVFIFVVVILGVLLVVVVIVVVSNSTRLALETQILSGMRCPNASMHAAVRMTSPNYAIIAELDHNGSL